MYLTFDRSILLVLMLICYSITAFKWNIIHIGQQWVGFNFVSTFNLDANQSNFDDYFLALQRIGDLDGPIDQSEEVSENELSWFIEGLELACYYSPALVFFSRFSFLDSLQLCY